MSKDMGVSDGGKGGASPASQDRAGALRAEPASQSQAKPLIADAGQWEPATGYSDAFYQIGKMLGIPAQDKSPSEVWHEQMRPMLAQRLAAYEPLLEALAGAVHFSDAVAHRDDRLSKALREWLKAGEAAIAKAAGAASRIEARSDQTPQAAEPVGREPDPAKQGDAQ